MKSREELKKELLSDPQKLMQKKPFYRGVFETRGKVCGYFDDKELGETMLAEPTHLYGVPVSQDRFMMELDPESHDVLFDENIPSITMKLKDGGYADLKIRRVAVPFQKLIKDKQVLHMTGNKTQHTLVSVHPDENVKEDFMTFKQYWDKRNIDGKIHDAVDNQKSYGDVGLLFYFDYKGEIKARILSYKDGYVICSHNDDNGDRLLESVVYYKDGVKYIDSYDDTYLYRWKSGEVLQDGRISEEWKLETPIKHGFEEIPLVTKRGDVAWNPVQSDIETYEVLYNVFVAIQKRYGWGILYIKGNFDEKGRKLAGNIILNDTSIGGDGDAKFLTPPTPENTISTLELVEEIIQKGSGTTFILPKDIKLSGDISGIAIELTQAPDIENAKRDCKAWQNFIDKCSRLFKYGVAIERVKKKEQQQALTDFKKVEIHSYLKEWKPRNEYEYNQMVQALNAGGILSRLSGVELNTLSKPDEMARIEKEDKEKEEKEARQLQQNNNSSGNQTEIDFKQIQ